MDFIDISAYSNKNRTYFRYRISYLGSNMYQSLTPLRKGWIYFEKEDSILKLYTKVSLEFVWSISFIGSLFASLVLFGFFRDSLFSIYFFFSFYFILFFVLLLYTKSAFNEIIRNSEYLTRKSFF
jgi:hypothetical protein